MCHQICVWFIVIFVCVHKTDAGRPTINETSFVMENMQKLQLEAENLSELFSSIFSQSSSTKKEKPTDDAHFLEKNQKTPTQV